MPRKSSTRKIAVGDFETDPFKYGREPKPFCVEFYSDERTEVFWGPDCAQQFMAFLETLEEPHQIYFHNGGRFDFFYLFDAIDEGRLKIINGRLVAAKVCNGRHELRDSYAILPVPLKSSGEKLDIDYKKLEAPVRHKHRQEILNYLHGDCLALYKMVVAFNAEFGNVLTIGKAAITELMKFHPFERMSPRQDAYYRQFYFGGRVECFKAGIQKGPWKVYDCNSMYPSVMRNMRHPINGKFVVGKRLPDNFDRPYFAVIDAVNHGALPWREARFDSEGKRQHGEITFNKKQGRFFACSHEIEAALELGLLDIQKVHYVSVAEEWTTFGTFVDTYYEKRMIAKRAGDKIYTLFYKLIPNSSYGKTGQNVAEYKDWYLNRHEAAPGTLIADGWDIWTEYDDFDLWSRPAQVHANSYYDVSIAASVCSGGRAQLLRAMAASDDLAYCDTDSVICREFHGDKDEYRLGAWKCEAEAATVAIAGKKLYALYNSPKAPAVKLASKGVKLTLPSIIEVCKGGEVEHRSEAPTFSFRRASDKELKTNLKRKTKATFIKRRVNRTVAP